MSQDFRAALERLITAYDQHGGKWPQHHEDALHDAVERARADLAAADADPDLAEGESSDGYHTFAELYQHRHSLMLALMRALPHLCWFSQRHHDGELPFGSADWFIVGANLPTGPITYHLPIELLSLARQTGAAELSAGHPWDGHTADDVIKRLRAWVAAAIEPDPAGGGEALLAAAPLEGEEPTTEELNRLYREIYGLHSDVLGPMPRKFARAVLARWGRPAVPPALVDGEVGKLVAWLNVEADLRRNDLSTPTGLNLAQAARQADRLQSWATLIQQQASELAALRAGVVAVSDRLPEPNAKVLAHYFDDSGKGRTVCAIWVPAKSRSDDADFADEDFTEYDEEDDKFYWPEGWYEAIENWDDLGWVKVDEGEVVYWQSLPKWPAHALPLPSPQGGEVEA